MLVTPTTMAGATGVVTGADTDIGYAVVERLLRAGVKIAAHVNNKKNTKRLTSLGTKIVLSGSPADDDTAWRTFAEAEGIIGPINLLVTCHSRPAAGALVEQSAESFWTHVDETLLGTAFFLQAAAKSMQHAGWGRAVLTTSAWSSGGDKLSAVASAAGGINILCKTAARELGRHNISVNVVSSAFIQNEWVECDRLGGPSLRTAPPSLGTPSEVAECVRLLCEPRIGAAVAQTIQCANGRFRHRI